MLLPKIKELPSTFFLLGKSLQNKHPFLLLFLLGLSVNLTFSPSFLWWAFPLFFSPVLLILDKMPSTKKLLWGSFLYHTGFFLGGVWWVSISLSIDWMKFWWVLPFSLLGIPVALAFLFMGTFYFFWKVKKTPLTKISLLITSTLLTEYIQVYYFPQFPWNLYGYILSSNDNILQFASLTGIFGLSALTLFFGALIYLWVQKTAGKQSSFSVLIILMVITIGGYNRLYLTPSILNKENAIRLVQPNIPQKLKWDRAAQKYIIEKLIGLSKLPSSLEIPFSFLIWPESAVPFFLEENSYMRFYLTRVLPPSAYLISGGGRRICADSAIPCSQQSTLKVWNSLFVLNEQGNIEDFYDKVHLVAFGEYIPLRAILGNIGLKKITHGTLDFSRGEGPKTIAFSQKPSFSSMICYESAFPKEILDPFHRPQWLLILTNDAWFGKSTGPYQHFEMARVRAVEEGLPVVRVANTGISAVIDPLGRVLKHLPLGQEGIIDTYLPSPLSPTLYGRFGNILAFLFLGIFWGILKIFPKIYKFKFLQ